MPNPVAANDLQPISGSLQTSRISYGVETAGKNYGQNYNSTTWYSDIPNNGQFYTIISDNYTANYYVSRSNAGGAYVEGGLPAVDEYSAPVFWVTVGTSSLDITTVVNGLPDRIGQTPFVSGAEALNWVASSSNYFAVGPDYYADIDADQLISFYHANQVISYPTTQSTWYDISGYGNNGTLINGVSFDSATGTLVFDGVDDGINLNNNFSGSTENNVTVECIVKLDTNQTSKIFAANYTEVVSPTGFGTGISDSVTNKVKWFTGNLGTTNTLTSSTTLVNGRYYHVVGTYNGSSKVLYLNSISEASATISNGINNTSTLASIGYLRGLNVQYLDGNLENVKIYSKALSAAEVAQNYYGGPIVTDSLIYAIDAGNIISYPRTGTAWYALTGSTNGTLTNGPTFSPIDGGYIDFDGTDDYVGFGNNILFPGVSLNGTISELTIDVWVNWNQFCIGGALDEIISWWAPGTQTYLDGFLGTSIISPYSPTNPGIRFGDDWVGTGVTFTAATDINKWWHIVAVKTSNNAYIYINGELRATKGSALDWGFNNYAYVAAHGGGATEFLDGKIASLRLYNKALTASEVLQNYNATK